MNKDYFIHKDVLGIKPHIRTRSKNMINLRSCELLHPRLSEIFSSGNSISLNEINLYPYPQETIERIAEQWQIPAETITLSAGSDPMISIIIEALGTKMGKILLQSPNYFGWHNYAALRNLSIHEILFGNPKRHAFCIENMLTAIKASSPSLVVISNPNSPTGFVFSEKEIKMLVDQCQFNGHLLIIDECFAGFANINHYKFIGPQEHVIFLRSFSKCFGLAGVRAAITIASKGITDYLTRWRPEAAVSGPALKMIEAFINKEEQFNELCKDIVTSRDQFTREVKKIRPEWLPLSSGGNYINFFLSNGDNPSYVAELLAQNGYHIRDVSSLPGLDSCIRFGIAHWEIMENLIKKLPNIVNQLTLMQ